MFRKQLVTALAMSLALAGCDIGSGPNQPGRLSILLTDAPGDFADAIVTIESIYLQSDDSEGDGGRVYLLETPTTVSLLDLRNQAMDLVKDAVVPGGSYSQLRIEISGGYVSVIETEDSEGVPTSTKIYASSPEYAAAQGVVADGDLQMPSYATSGLKINLPGGSVEIDGDQKILLLDFNVAESFGKQAGQSGKWVMTPVIQALELSTTVGVEFTLTLADSVVLPAIGENAVTLADFAATLDKDGDVIDENFVDQSGTYRVNFYFLEAGTEYPVTFIEPVGLNVTLDPAFPATVTVPSGTLRQTFEITSAVLE